MSKQSDQNEDGKPAANDFAEQMRLARIIMDDRWEVLRALALSDTYPDADAHTLLRMARDQGRGRPKISNR